MKKVAVVVLAIALLMVCFALPVMAESPKKIAVTFSLLKSATTSYTGATKIVTPSGITHWWGCTRTVPEGFVVLTREGMSTLVGSLMAEVDMYINPNTAVIRNHYHKWHLYFPGGTFEGVNTWVAELGPNLMATLEGHAVLQGTGIFEGQTLSLYNDPGHPLAGWLLIP